MGQQGTVEHVFVQCLPGLEQVLENEARSLGRVRTVENGVELEGPPGVHAEAALVLRVAERVLLRLLEARSLRWQDVEKALRGVSLACVAEPGSAVVLEASTRIPDVPGLGAVTRALSSAWKRRVEAASGTNRESKVPRLALRVAHGTATLSADVGGSLLHRRGWRQELSRAPLRETLAAGVLGLARQVPGHAVWDPVCGSGTLVIEAALISRSIAPGLGRSFAAEQWPLAAQVDWAGRRERLRAAVRPRAGSTIVGSDLNAGALGTARRNARRAGVLQDLRLERLDVASLDPGPLTGGLLVGNLPYGVRVCARGGLEAFDLALAKVLTGRFRAWRRALLVDDPARLGRAGGREPDRSYRLVNGGIPVVLGTWEPIEGVEGG